MSTTDNDLLREAIRRTLAKRAGSAPDAKAVAEGTLSTWRQVTDRLTPIIGARGVDVLFSRSLHLTNAAFPWPAIARNNVEGTTPLENFTARLAAQEAAAATEASYALLLTFTELLATLIGESLTKRLLKPVWVPPSSTSEQDTTS